MLWMITYHYTPALNDLLERQRYTLFTGRVGSRGYAIVARPLRSAVPVREFRRISDIPQQAPSLASEIDRQCDQQEAQAW